MASDPSDSARSRPAPVDGPADTLIVIHVPKTAGTALRHVLDAAYDASERAWLYDPQHVDGAMSPDTFRALPESERASARIVMGHVAYGLHEHVPGPSTYVTMLRDPVERVISTFEHFRTYKGLRYRLVPGSLLRLGPAADERARIEREGLTLEDWVFEGRQLQVDNGAVRMLSGRQRVPFGTCPDDLLDEALEHVEARFSALLVQERMEPSLALLRAVTGRPLGAISRRNVNRRRASGASIEPRVRERIAELNALDRRLHELALERLTAAADRIGRRR